MGTKFYVNSLTKEMETVPNSTDYSNLQMLQRGFEEVSLKYFSEYMEINYINVED
jgi:hypothetical protein